MDRRCEAVPLSSLLQILRHRQAQATQAAKDAVSYRLPQHTADSLLAQVTNAVEAAEHQSPERETFDQVITQLHTRQL